MSVSYDEFAKAFLKKISEYKFLCMEQDIAISTIDSYMKTAIYHFHKICKYDLYTTSDDHSRTFNVDIPQNDLTGILDIVSEGMVLQWLKPYVYNEELLENSLSTREFSVYSPSEVLLRVGETYRKAQKDYKSMVKEYSYDNGDLRSLHI